MPSTARTPRRIRRQQRSLLCWGLACFLLLAAFSQGAALLAASELDGEAESSQDGEQEEQQQEEVTCESGQAIHDRRRRPAGAGPAAAIRVIRRCNCRASSLLRAVTGHRLASGHLAPLRC